MKDREADAIKRQKQMCTDSPSEKSSKKYPAQKKLFSG